MQEELVSFETAKLAKEKGFDLEFCNVGWHGDFGDLKGDNYPFLGTYSFYKSIYCNNKDEHQIQRPTQSLLQKWLREVYNTHLMVEPFYNEQKVLVYGLDLITERIEEETIVEKGFKTYEEALEVGLQEALKLIEIVKEK
jgi:hypothetical protein